MHKKNDTKLFFYRLFDSYACLPVTIQTFHFPSLFISLSHHDLVFRAIDWIACFRYRYNFLCFFIFIFLLIFSGDTETCLVLFLIFLFFGLYEIGYCIVYELIMKNGKIFSTFHLKCSIIFLFNGIIVFLRKK